MVYGVKYEKNKENKNVDDDAAPKVNTMLEIPETHC